MEIDDFPLHWEDTLLGYEFWKDIDEFEKEIERRQKMRRRSPSPSPSPTPNLELESPSLTQPSRSPPPTSRFRRWSSFHFNFGKNTDKKDSNTSTGDSNLHKRFPFNLEPKLAPTSDDAPKNEHPSNQQPSDKLLPVNSDTATPTPTTRYQHHRKFSMSDIKEFPILNRKMSFTSAKERIRELNESLAPSPTTPSPTRSQGPWTPTTYERKLEMTPPKMFTTPSKVSVAARKMAIEEKELPKTPSPSPSPPKFDLSALVAASASSSAVSDVASRVAAIDINTGSSSPKATEMKISETGQRTLLTEQQRDELRYSPASYNIATFAKPLMDFRGGDAWDEIPNRKPTLGLDLFRPQSDDDDGVGFDCLDVSELAPLLEFRRLRSLKLTGMLQSYQSVIWQVVWLNPDLQELELGMALEPEIVNKVYKSRWKVINDKWVMDKKKMAGTPTYFGNNGDGELHEHIGHGEYLDKQAIEKAKVAASSKMENIKRRITIRKLTLTGFVVDADSFVQWFDPETLRGIHFKDHCVDAGFWLPLALKGVVVRSPRAIDIRGVPLGIVKVDMMKDLKVVEIHKGVDTKVMSYKEYLETKDEDEKKANEKNVGDKKADVKDADAKKLDMRKLNAKLIGAKIKELEAKQLEAKKLEAKKLDFKKIDVKKANAKKLDFSYLDVKKADANKTDTKEADEKKVDTKKADTLDDKPTI